MRLRLILGDQLNEQHSWFREKNDDVIYLMMEILPETSYVKHHIQKIVGIFLAMRAFASKIARSGHRVKYIRLDDPDNKQSFAGNIKQIIEIENCSGFEYMQPDEYRVDHILAELCTELDISSTCVDSEHFLTERYELRDFFSSKKRYLMESFYRELRKRKNILMDHASPIGGQWNYDKMNRDAYNPDIPIQPALEFNNDPGEILEMIDRMKVSYFGNMDENNFIWPTTREQSLTLLQFFLENGLPYFGSFQDAMISESWSLFHSRLSFSMNTKMLHPGEIINEVIDYWSRKSVGIELNQVEGFIRQILGWREYMRGIYWTLMPEFAIMNYFEHHRELPHYFWNANTDMNCIHTVVKQSLNTAYAHHIQRLMITGNFCLLAGIDPDFVDEWYLGIYIDAIEWVEKPNTRGMSQFADAGIIATKPYVSSSNYIHKMSDYCVNCFYDHSVKYGTKACPFNSLFWHFYVRHREKLKKNPRIAMMYRTWDRMTEENKKQLLEQAERYLTNLDML